MPFLSIVTRCYKRPESLKANVASVANQTDQDYEHLFIVDDVGRGMEWANRALATATPAGDYVLVLDDDDILSEPRAIEYLKEAAVDKPDVIIFRGDFGEVLGILPDAVVWGNRPIKGHIGSAAFATSRDVWEKHVTSYGAKEGGDYEYLKALWQDKPAVVWLDKLITTLPTGQSWGAPE